MNVELFKSLSKYPFICDDELFDSEILIQNTTCLKKCKTKDCIDFFKKNQNQNEFLCPMGFNNVILKFKDQSIIINGIIYRTNKTIQKGRREARKDWVVNPETVYEFIEKIYKIDQYILKCTNETIVKNFSMFHDFKTSMTILFSCAQDIINKLPGDTFLEKLEYSDKSYKDLYNALELITSQLRMIDVIINPRSIVFGKKKSINIYRLFEKIKVLFSHLSTKKKDINIILLSEGWVFDSNCYESIEFIPLILLDNALKYSVSDSDIEVKFEQNQNSVKVIVKSIGPFVSDENKEKIFQKFFRDKSAEDFSKEGIGMGLWIAQEILHAHNSEIHYYKDPKETRPIGLNVFEFDLQTIN
jgi:hypothetical protein